LSIFGEKRVESRQKVQIFVKIGVEPTLKLQNSEFLVLNQDLKLETMKKGVGPRPKMIPHTTHIEGI